jgi:hypothetical protein
MSAAGQKGLRSTLLQAQGKAKGRAGSGDGHPASSFCLVKSLKRIKNS